MYSYWDKGKNITHAIGLSVNLKPLLLQGNIPIVSVHEDPSPFGKSNGMTINRTVS